MSAVESIASEFDTDPEAALECIAAHDGPVLVDLDETLYLRNSTEDFIDLARPAFMAALLLRCLDVIRPWRWSGGDSTRDTWRVRLIMILFPWTRLRWARQVHTLAQRFGNRALLATFQRYSIRPIVVTSGFRPIVTPLIAAVGLPDSQIVAARVTRSADRARGKLACTVEALGDEAVGRALLITDSLQDAPVLRVCKRPLRTIWPHAVYRRAFADVYLPGEYLTRVKRPGTHYIRRGILQEDFAFWVLSSVALAVHPMFHVAGLLLLLGSFWAIYERGYVENDNSAIRFEKDPKVDPAYWYSPVATPAVAPWIWAAVLGVLGILTLRWPDQPRPWDFASWALVLVVCYLWFRAYNRLDKSTRVWLYAGLQIARVGAFAALVPVPVIGAAALGANALSRWVPYYLYRNTGNRWPKRDESPLIRLTWFLVLAAVLALSQGPASVFSWTALLLLLWNAYRARPALKNLLKHARRLDRLGGEA